MEEPAWHERFRWAVVNVLGTTAEEPKHVAALEALAGQLRSIAAGDERATRVATSRRFIGGN